MSTVELRIRRLAEVGECVRVLRAVHEQRGYPVNWPADPAGWISGTPAWIAVVDGAVAGHVAVTRAAGAALVERLFVDPVRAGSGIGRTLLRHAVRAARGLSAERGETVPSMAECQCAWHMNHAQCAFTM